MSETNITTGSARKVRKLPDMRGDAAVYELTPPYQTTHFDYETRSDVPGDLLQYVVVSAVDLGIFSPGFRTSETMIFPSDGEEVSDFGELAMVPYKSHADALSDIGYEVSA